MVNGIDFIYGENPDHFYYETVAGNDRYCILQPRNLQGLKPYWAIIVSEIKGQRMMPLNCATLDSANGIKDKGPLYVDSVLEPPIETWLKMVAQFIKEGNSPFD